MKQKELKSLASKIAKQERIINAKDSTDEEIKRAENEIEKLSARIHSFEDMCVLDEMIQKILN